MCTAITFLSGDFYFGRTLDNDCSYGEEVVIAPRKFFLPLRCGGGLEEHYAMIGMAHVADTLPLYYDAFNEKGLCMAGLNFVGNACYGAETAGKTQIAPFEFIPYILGTCADVEEALKTLARIALTDTPYSARLPAAQLHWMIADRRRAVTVECVREGMKIYENAAGVLTNNPPFDVQTFYLNNFLGLSPAPPRNTFAQTLDLKVYSHGMGALGLPGDFSSMSRFVKAAYVRANAVCGDGEEESVSQFFHILDTVAQPRGVSRTDNGGSEYTLYASCCNADRGVYYYVTYLNRAPEAVSMHDCALEGTQLTRCRL